jgi:hypothetical protein
VCVSKQVPQGMGISKLKVSGKVYLDGGQRKRLKTGGRAGVLLIRDDNLAQNLQPDAARNRFPA